MDLKKLKEETPEERLSRVTSTRKMIDDYFMKNGLTLKDETPTKEEMKNYTISFNKH